MRIGVFGRESGFAALAKKAGLEPHGAPRDAEDEAAFEALGAPTFANAAAWLDALAPPRLFFLDLAAGAAIDRLIDEIYAEMEPGDVVVDLSPSWWSDTARRYRRMKHRSIYYVDAAILPMGGRHRVVASGDVGGVELAAPALAAIQGSPIRRLGAAGAAHFSAMVADALAAARAQAASDARQMVEAFWGEIDVDEATLAIESAETPPTGRAFWALDDALRLQATAPTFAQAAMLRLADHLDDFDADAPPPRLHPPVTEEDYAP